MEAWQKGAPVVKKMSKAGQASYFKKFPDRESWFKQNHPDMAHFDTSAKQGSIQKVDKAKLAARAAMSLKAHGATKGVATGGEGGNAETPHKDTIAPLTRDQHSAVQSAKRSAEAPAPAKKEAPKAAPAAKPVDRLALIKQIHKKTQSAAGKQKRAAKFDVPTEDPDDAAHDDYVKQHYGMHHYSEEVEQVEEGKIQNIATKKDDDGDYEATLTHAVKMAKGVAYDKRYKGGNMTGATKAIRAIGKKHGIGNLENHPDVKGALRMANEEVEHTDASKELVLHADNNSHLHRTSHQPIMANLKKKVEKGTYNHAKAKTLWKYHADRAAHSYAKEHGDGHTPWHKMFSVADRNRAANHFADAAKEHLGLNESYTGKGNHKPGWMLRADPELAAKFKEIAKRKQLKNKYAGKTSDEVTALKKEEVEQIDELKSKTLANYIKKASHDVTTKGALTRQFSNDARAAYKDQDFRTASRKGELSDKTFNKSWERRKFIAKAADKLAARTNEEVEQIDEESAHSIVNNLKSDGKHQEAGAKAFEHGLGRKYGQHFGLRSTKDKDEASFHRGYDQAEAKSKKKVDEEVQYIEERLTKSNPPSEWIHDFVKSDNPKFAGKTKKERMSMALGAYYSAKRGK